MKKILMLVWFSIVFINIYTYGQAPMARQGDMPVDGKLSGKIIDSSSSSPVEYASVAIYRSKDSTLVTGVVTDAMGNFNLDNLPYGRYYATVTFIGYKKMNVDNIAITPTKKAASLGTVKLDPASTSLNEVVVIGNGNQIEYKIDKKIVNISQNIVSAGGTVVDALQNTPSIQTDVEGNLTLRGSSNFTVLIDGKPSVVEGSEALQQIPAGMVQNVEIITNPSAKYDAEGSAGIINIIMKKQKVKGFNGSISLSAGTNKKNNDNLNLNYKYNKWNFSLGVDWRDMGFKMENASQKEYYSDTLNTYQQINGSGKFNRSGLGLRGGIEFNPNNNNSLSLTGRIGNRAFDRPTSYLYLDKYDYINDYPRNDSTLYYKSITTSSSEDEFYSVNLDYNLKLDDKGQQIAATVYYSGSNEEDPSNMQQDTTEAGWTEVINTYKQRVEESGDETEFRFKADYTLPINDKSKLEAGFQVQIDNSFSKHALYIFDNTDQLEKLDQYEELNFDQNINAAYVTYSSENNILAYQLGLRMENENREVDQLNDSDTSMNRYDFFPTIHLSKKLPWDLQLQTSYTRRLSRPRQWDLSPLKRYMDPQNVRYGNPALKPEITDAYEVNIQKKINDASSLSVEGFYRKTLNPIQQITSVIDKVSYVTSINLEKSESLGGEAMLNIGLTKWWTINASGSLYNYKLSGDMESGVQSKNSTNWNLNANTMLRFKTGTTLQMNYSYNAPTVTAQGSRGSYYTSGLAVRQDLLKKKGSLTLQFRDWIGDPKMESKTETSNYYSFSEWKRETKVITLTFTYRINNYKAQNKRGSEDINTDGGGDMGGEMM
jgi:outer membrane receptor protein involved in Fe transport